MKKLLISILTILGFGLTFCSADVFNFLDDFPDLTCYNYTTTVRDDMPVKFSVQFPIVLKSFCFSSKWSYYDGIITYSLDSGSTITGTTVGYESGSNYCVDFPNIELDSGDVMLYSMWSCKSNGFCNYTDYSLTSFGDSNKITTVCGYYPTTSIYPNIGQYFYSGFLINIFPRGPYTFYRGPVVYYDVPGCPDPDPQEITIHYNNNQSSTTISCDGNPDVYINGLSTITSMNTFTPYYNISYKDEDNQSLIESYDHNILYLENAQFKKTYTGSNDWILTAQGGSNGEFGGYIPSFDVSGSVDPNDQFTGNIFNNFADNSLKVLLSNIPNYIQYVLIIVLLFFVLGFIRKFKRR